jgi:hypothetical protein
MKRSGMMNNQERWMPSNAGNESEHNIITGKRSQYGHVQVSKSKESRKIPILDSGSVGMLFS